MGNNWYLIWFVVEWLIEQGIPQSAAEPSYLNICWYLRWGWTRYGCTMKKEELERITQSEYSSVHPGAISCNSLPHPSTSWSRWCCILNRRHPLGQLKTYISKQRTHGKCWFRSVQQPESNMVPHKPFPKLKVFQMFGSYSNHGLWLS